MPRADGQSEGDGDGGFGPDRNLAPSRSSSGSNRETDPSGGDHDDGSGDDPSLQNQDYRSLRFERSTRPSRHPTGVSTPRPTCRRLRINRYVRPAKLNIAEDEDVSVSGFIPRPVLLVSRPKPGRLDLAPSRPTSLATHGLYRDDSSFRRKLCSTGVNHEKRPAQYQPKPNVKRPPTPP